MKFRTIAYLVINMYFLVMLSLRHRPWKNRLLPLPAGPCSLGSLTMAGTIRHGRGAGHLHPRVLGQWAFVYLVEGKGIYEDNHGNRQELRAGHWILVFPELAHHYGPQSGQLWNEVYVCFQGPVFEQWRQSGILDARQPVGTLAPVDFWWKELALLLRTLAQPETSPLEAVTLWQHWLGRILTLQIPLKTETDLWIEQACRLLAQELAGENSAGRPVSARLNMGYENFRKKFVRHMGISPGRYREKLRIEKAKQLLQSKRITNQELADMLGFCDEAHFSKSFRRLTGASPRDFSQSQGNRGLQSSPPSPGISGP